MVVMVLVKRSLKSLVLLWRSFGYGGCVSGGVFGVVVVFVGKVGGDSKFPLFQTAMHILP